MGSLTITQLRAMTATKLKEYVEANSPVTITSRLKPVVIINKLGTAPDPTPDPDPTPTPDPVPTPVTGLPSKMFGKNWTCMAPFNKIGSTNSPENLYITKAEVDNRYKPWFYTTDKGVVFKTPASGAHSANSKYSRTELREMINENWDEAEWSMSSGTHTMELREAVRYTFVKRPQVVCAQIHGADDDLMQVALDGSKLVVFWDDKNQTAVLEPNYVQGTFFDVKIVATGGRVKVSYNGTQKADFAASGSGNYFKAGCYNQSNVANWGEAPDAYGEVTISSFKVSHS